MDEVKTSKTVKEVFKDYNSNSFVLNAARVIGIDLYKKKSDHYKQGSFSTFIKNNVFKFKLLSLQ